MMMQSGICVICAGCGAPCAGTGHYRFLGNKVFHQGCESKAADAAELTALRERVKVLEADKRDLLRHADVQRMPVRLLPEALEVAEEAFSNRGDHGGSPGEWAWERMSEIETRIKRAAMSKP